MRDKHKDIFRYIAGIPKSFYFNFKKFGFLKALKFPVILSSNVILDNVSGDIEIKKMKPFGVRIGFGHSDIYVYQGEKTILKNSNREIIRLGARNSLFRVKLVNEKQAKYYKIKDFKVSYKNREIYAKQEFIKITM